MGHYFLDTQNALPLTIYCNILIYPKKTITMFRGKDPPSQNTRAGFLAKNIPDSTDL